MGISLPLVGLATGAAKASIDFESAFAGVRKTIDGTETQFVELETGIRNMSKSLPESAVSIANIAESAGQLGIKTADILGFTKVMIDLGETKNLTSQEAATSLAQLANITKMSSDSPARSPLSPP